MNRIAALMVVRALEEIRDLPEDSPRVLLAELPERSLRELARRKLDTHDGTILRM